MDPLFLSAVSVIHNQRLQSLWKPNNRKMFDTDPGKPLGKCALAKSDSGDEEYFAAY